MAKETQSFAIVGAGLTGLSTAWFLRRAFPQSLITIFESEAQVGGKIRSNRHPDFPHEEGPNGFLSNRMGIVNLCRELDLDIQLSDQNAAIRYLWLKNSLMRLPDGPVGMMLWKGLGLGSKLGLLGDLFKKPRSADDESVYDFVSQQFSEEMAMNMADPFVAGVFAADCKKLSMRSAFPEVFAAQRAEGSIIKGLRTAKKQAEHKAGKSEKKPRAKLCNLEGGMAALPLRLAELFQNELALKKSVKSVKRCDDGVLVHTEDGEEITFDAAFLACPAGPMADLIQSDSSVACEALKQISYTPVGVAICSWRKKIELPPGFGFLVPSHEKSRVLGVLFSSQIFPDNHRPGGTTLRIMFGGGSEPDLLERSDDELRKILFSELESKLGIQQEADYFHLVRWHKALPMYACGHYKLVETIESEFQGSALIPTGSALYGVSMNDCVVSAAQSVKELINLMESKK